MNVYATNQPAEGYEFQGSFGSLGEAQAWAEARDEGYAHWWADEEDGERPEWASTPVTPSWVKEARALLQEGADPEGMVHFINDDPERGLSNPLTREELQRGGYTSRYYRLGDLAV